jgi:hypothetical protein
MMTVQWSDGMLVSRHRRTPRGWEPIPGDDLLVAVREPGPKDLTVELRRFSEAAA